MDNETDVIILSDSPEELLVAGEEKSVSVEPVQVAAEGDGLSRLNQHINPNPISIETGDITEDDAAIDDEEEATSGSDSDEDEAEDSDLSGDADHDTLVAEKTAEKKPLGGLAVGPRRSKRSNFGNRYEQAISKEKEDGKPPLQNGDLLDEEEDDSEEDDTDFRPDATGNGIKSDHSHSSGSGSDSSSSGDDENLGQGGKQNDERKPHAHKKRDPLNALCEQKQSLEELLNEIATSPKLDNVKVCSVCLWDEYDVEKDAVVQCDSCGVPVHEACYGVVGKELEEAHAEDSGSESSMETMPWFCDPCRFGEKNPRCIACPNKYGAYKQTTKGDWIHSSCARYIKEVYFDDEERLSDVVVGDLPFSRWGDRPCVVCEDVYAKNAGVTIQCETGMCRKYLHATCAMIIGSATEMEPEMGYPLAVYCPDHTPKEDRTSNRRCFLASLGLQRKHQIALLSFTEEEKQRLNIAEKKQRKIYTESRTKRTLVDGLQPVARPLHSAYWLLMKGHERSEALGWDAKPVVNSNPSIDNVRSSRPDFRPEFVAYVYKRERMIAECLERMDAAKEARIEINHTRKFDPTIGKAASKRYLNDLKSEKDTLLKLLAPFMPFIDKRTLPKAKSGSPRRRTTPRSGRESNSSQGPSHPRTLEPRCKTCNSASFPQRMLQCDDCKEWFHLKCLDPPLTSMPYRKSKGIKWLCSGCAPSEEDSDVAASEEKPTEGRKRRRLQGKNPLRDKRDQPEQPKTPPADKKRRERGGRKIGRPPKKVKSTVPPTNDGKEGEASTSAVGPESKGVGKGRPKSRSQLDESQGGICCKCHEYGTSKEAVECDKCQQWFHFAKCLDPPLVRSPRTRFYGWLCEDCGSPDPEEDSTLMDE